MFSDQAIIQEESFGVIPALDLEEFYAKFPWDSPRLSRDQEQLLGITKRYFLKVCIGRKIVRDQIENKIICLNPSAVGAYVYFYKAYKRSGLACEYPDIDVLLSLFLQTIDKLEMGWDISQINEFKPILKNIHLLFFFISVLPDSFD